MRPIKMIGWRKKEGKRPHRKLSFLNEQPREILKEKKATEEGAFLAFNESTTKNE